MKLVASYSWVDTGACCGLSQSCCFILGVNECARMDVDGFDISALWGCGDIRLELLFGSSGQ